LVTKKKKNERKKKIRRRRRRRRKGTAEIISHDLGARKEEEDRRFEEAQSYGRPTLNTTTLFLFYQTSSRSGKDTVNSFRLSEREHVGGVLETLTSYCVGYIGGRHLAGQPLLLKVM